MGCWANFVTLPPPTVYRSLAPCLRPAFTPVVGPSRSPERRRSLWGDCAQLLRSLPVVPAHRSLVSATSSFHRRGLDSAAVPNGLYSAARLALPLAPVGPGSALPIRNPFGPRAHSAPEWGLRCTAVIDAGPPRLVRLPPLPRGQTLESRTHGRTGMLTDKPTRVRKLVAAPEPAPRHALTAVSSRPVDSYPRIAAGPPTRPASLVCVMAYPQLGADQSAKVIEVDEKRPVFAPDGPCIGHAARGPRARCRQSVRPSSAKTAPADMRTTGAP